MITFEGITKSFGGVPVLRDVSFAVPPGRTVGIVGENGAGKSTLMNILGGNLQPDRGSMRWEGEVYAPRNPRDAARRGVAFVHQELNLFPNLSIAENLFLTTFPKLGRLPLIDRATLHRRTAEWLEQVGLTHPPDILVDRLSAGERQLVEIAKALSLDAKLIILDEPTTSLSAREAERLFALMGRLRERGIAMIYISHTLPDVLRLCDEIVVLRDGEVVGSGPRADFNIERMIALMVGRSLNQLYPERRAAPVEKAGEVILEVRGVTQPGIVRNVSMNLRCGEVLGIFGLMGAGRSELARILFGLDPCEKGDIRVAGQSVFGAPPRRRIQRGLAFLTENRREEGLCLEATIAENITLVSLRQYQSNRVGLLNMGRLREAVNAIRGAVRLTPTAGNEAPVKILSGGNQQKVVLAKWLLAKSGVLILDEPTRGIDVGAKFEIYQLIHELADNGAGVLMISSELEELTGICDRLLVMRRGEIVAELRREAFDGERILAAALGETVETGAP